MRRTRSWKHLCKKRKQYGRRDTARYDSPFMILDEYYLEAR